MKVFNFIICSFFVIFLLYSFLYAQETKNKSKVKLTADSTSIPWGENEKNITLRGNVSIIYEDTKLMSAYVIFNQETKFAQSPGKVSVISKESNFTGDKASCDFKNKICKINGNIKGYIKKETSNKIENIKRKDKVQKEITNNIDFVCDEAEYNYKTKILNAFGNIKISEKGRLVTCDKLTYNSKEEVFYLNGNVKGVDDKGQTFESAGEVKISIKENNEYIKAPDVKSTFYVDIED